MSNDFFQAPLGGTREQGSHKGYGFALMAEVLATALSGALPTMLAPGSGSKNQFAAYNIAAETLTVADVAALAEGREPGGGAAWTVAPQLDYHHSVAEYLRGAGR